MNCSNWSMKFKSLLCTLNGYQEKFIIKPGEHAELLLTIFYTAS